MYSLGNLLWLVLASMLAIYWWQSGLYKGRARELATAHCQQLGLQLLDQSMVIVGFWPVRDRSGRLVFRRSYQFEFSSTGDKRYQGRLVLEGILLKSIQLEVYRPPETD